MTVPDAERATPPDELRRSRDQLQIILQGVTDGITAVDAAGKLTFANRAALAALGFATLAELLATPPGAVMDRYDVLDEHGAPMDPAQTPTRRALGGVAGEALMRFRVKATGEERWSQVAANPVLDPDGRVAVVITIFRDITERRRAEDALRVSFEWFETTLRSIGDAVIATDAAGRVTFMNAVAEDLTGWPVADARGQDLKTVFPIVHETTREEVESPVTKVLREGCVVGLANHTILLARDGREVAIDDSGAPIRNGSGALVGVVLVFRDVTEKRREEERRLFVAEASGILASSLDYATTLGTVARLAIPHVADGCSVYVAEPAGPVRQLAIAHADPEKEKLGRELDRLYPLDPEATQGVPFVLRTGKTEALFEIPDAFFAAVTRDPEQLRRVRELGVTSRIVVPMRTRGRTLGALVLTRTRAAHPYGPDDVPFAEQLASAAALAVDNARLYGEAQEANRLKDEFLATVSHELRTPLNAMLGWARMLRAGNLAPAMQAKALATIERNAQAQAQLVDDLLDVSRIITGKLRLDVRSIDLGAVIDAAIDAVRPAAEAKSVRVDTDVDRFMGPLLADPGRLEQVVWNLLSNAVKFTPKGGRVVVTAHLADSRVRVAVTDTGVGIAADFLPFVFDRFRQADLRGTKKSTGLGLGLAIVKHLVELHGGTVGVASEGEGQGATFTVDLPIAPVHRQDAPSPTQAAGRMALPTLSGLRVLVVDDEVDSRELLQIALEDLGAKVEVRGSAAEALAAVPTFRPDVVVSDIGMPMEDGYSLIAKIRALPPEQGGRVPAAALTAFARAEDRARALLAGFNQHVAKPIDPAELAAVVANLAGRTGNEP